MLGCFENNGIASCQCRADFDRDKKQLRIPWHHCSDHAKRFPKGQGNHIRLVDGQGLAADFICAASIKVKEFGNIFCLPARFFQHFSSINGFYAAQMF